MSTYVITDLRGTNLCGPSPSTFKRLAGPGDAGSRAQSGSLRLTRRGRLVIFAVALLIVLGLSVIFGGGSVATSERGEPSPTEIITVVPGDTLWAIASEIAADTDERDVRTVMARIEGLNALESGMLQVGQELRVPKTD